MRAFDFLISLLQSGRSGLPWAAGNARAISAIRASAIGQFRVLATACYRGAEIVSICGLTTIQLSLAVAPIGRGVDSPLNPLKLPFVGRGLSWQIDLDAIFRVYHTHMSSTDLIRELKKAGWRLARVNGSHHVFTHPQLTGIVVVPHPKKDLGKGLVKAIRQQAGI